jgi:hypothetical protein
LDSVEGCLPFTFASSAFGLALLVFRTLEERKHAIGMVMLC